MAMGLSNAGRQRRYINRLKAAAKVLAGPGDRHHHMSITAQEKLEAANLLCGHRSAE
jgi:hypothetical protein